MPFSCSEVNAIPYSASFSFGISGGLLLFASKACGEVDHLLVIHISKAFQCRGNKPLTTSLKEKTAVAAKHSIDRKIQRQYSLFPKCGQNIHPASFDDYWLNPELSEKERTHFLAYNYTKDKTS